MTSQLELDLKRNADSLRERLRRLLSDGQARTLFQMREALLREHGAHYSDGGISAKVRDLRKAEHGAETIHLQHIRRQVYSYRMKTTNGGQ
jgi:hypothetical protein